MNKAKLKSYAPQARKDFIAAVTARANLLGLSEKAGALEVAPSQPQGDVTVIAGQAWPVKVHTQREQLIARIRKDGFAHTMEAIAYTWFNRFAALRYMELHDYLGHGHRALSSTSGGLPDILTHATDLTNELPGLNAAKVTELKLAGNRDGELYRMLLVAQCNALSRAMPFLFERIDDDSELLLPDNLLRSDSVIAKLVEEIPEEDWAEVEIIGWLYQFYISEKKDQVIGKVVKSEDIPAATQLFTPNWIVQYLVQNSVGRLWLMANPQSTLAKEWPYYITPAEQTPEVQAQLDALIQTRVREDGDTLNPESITVLDPACGSGHILVVAYDVLKAIYLERGYQARSIPRLILEKNLFGLDIDDRAAQMAGFALLMKARADDRRLFTATDDAGNLQPPKLNVLSLQESKGLNVDELLRALPPLPLGEGWGEGGFRATITALVDTFEHAKTFGSLIQIPDALMTHLAVLPEVLALVKQSGDMYASAAADDLLPLVQQAQMLAMQFDAVVANPPYMGSGYFNLVLKNFVNDAYPDGKADLYSAFTLRNLLLGKQCANIGMITIPNWMYLASFESFRSELNVQCSISSLLHNGRGIFGSDFGSSAFCLNKGVTSLNGAFLKLFDKQGSVSDNEEIERRFHTSKPFISSTTRHEKISGKPIAYWASEKVVSAFAQQMQLEEISKPRVGLQTGDNNKFLRLWHEVDVSRIGFSLKPDEVDSHTPFRWFPYNKGGAFKRWYGNSEWIVNWENDGNEIRKFGAEDGGKPRSRAQNTSFYFRPSISWSKVTIGAFSVRYYPTGHLFDVAGCSLFLDTKEELLGVLGLLNSVVTKPFLSDIAQSVNFEVGQIAGIPLPKDHKEVFSNCCDGVEKAIALSSSDWDDFEVSWGFQGMGIQVEADVTRTLSGFHARYSERKSAAVRELAALEEKNNSLFINAYGLQDELSPEVLESQITLTSADREEDCQRLISYAVGCMMGRYSLDEPGLIYAHAGNVGFEPGRYATFPADADGIVPITDELWFADDAPSRIREFLRAVWGPDTLEENMAWLAESLGKKSAKEASETPDETIRRYIADKFFKDHLQTYKKRPIYWLFSSGKQGAFQALVYLHRYHEGTLARLRAEYVVPLTGKIQSRIEMLQKDAASASSAAARNKLAKEVEKLKKKHVELLAYDEQLRHYADMRITLNLDDGVKVNYGKFGDLLDSVKVVTGGTSDE